VKHTADFCTGEIALSKADFLYAASLSRYDSRHFRSGMKD
jgi:hypothetical protein